MCQLLIGAFNWLISRSNELKQELDNFQATMEENSLEMWGLIGLEKPICFIITIIGDNAAGQSLSKQHSLKIFSPANESIDDLCQ